MPKIISVVLQIVQNEKDVAQHRWQVSVQTTYTALPEEAGQQCVLSIDLLGYDGPNDPDNAQNPQPPKRITPFIFDNPQNQNQRPFLLEAGTHSITSNNWLPYATLDEDPGFTNPKQGTDEIYAVATLISDIQSSNPVQHSEIVTIDNPPSIEP